MIIIPRIDSVGYALYCSDEDHEYAISVSTPMILSVFCKSKFNPKKNQASLLVAFKKSKHYLIIVLPSDVPTNDVYCPDTGKILIKYELEDSGKALMRVIEENDEKSM